MSCRQSDKTEENPEEGHALNHQSRELSDREPCNPQVRTPGRYGSRLCVQECISENGCANEADEGCEAHQNIEELLDSVYEGHDEARIFYPMHMVVLSLAILNSRDQSNDRHEQMQKLKSCSC